MRIYENIWKHMETYGNIWKHTNTYENMRKLRQAGSDLKMSPIPSDSVGI